MLNREIKFYQNESVIFMSNSAILAASIKVALREIAKQAKTLGTGLQNAAPGDKAGTPNNTVQYLLSMAENIEKTAEEFGAMAAPTDQSQL